jgi:ornithine cyclodeaminase
MPHLERLAADEIARDGLRCSFCDKQPADGSELIAGPGVFICGECIAISTDLLSGDRNTAAQATDSPDSENETTGEAQEAPIVFRLLTAGDVAHLVTIDDLIDEMREALRRFSSGDVVQPVRTVIPVDQDGDLLALMPAYVRSPAALGAKLVTKFDHNAQFGLPSHLAIIALLDPKTGALTALLDGQFITTMRTAAVSAISADLLAQSDCSTLAIIGSGVQARSHLQALEHVFELSHVKVWSPTPSHQFAFLEEMESETQAKLVGADSAEQAVQGADLIVLATSSSEPVVQNEWIKAGAHVMSVGACQPNQREMDSALVRRGRLFVDSRAAALVEAGDVVLAIAEHAFSASHIAGELGELLAGKVEGRRSSADVTIFKSLGLAVEDVAAADLVYRRAAVQGAGRTLEL